MSSLEPVHDSAAKHVSGTAVYIDDIPPDHEQKYVAVGGSEIAHGEILSLDLSAVLESEGVVDVITVKDIPGHGDIGPVFPGDPLLTSKAIDFYGQAVFAVLARSHDLARRAVTKARIEYQKAEPVLDLNVAIEHEYYVRPPHRMQRGEAQTHLDLAPYTVTNTFTVGGQEHFYLEGQVASAVADEDGGMIVRSSNQNPTEAQKLVAEVLGIPMNAVTVETRRMGGGFGGKETQANASCCLAAVFASRNGCRVVCRLSRRDDMVMTGKRHNFQNSYEAGFHADGTLEALFFRLAGQCGASPDLSDAIVDRAMFHSDNAYFLPHVQIDGLRCKTHTVSNTAFRGFGGPQGIIAMETVIDEIAFALKIDALDVRKRNFYGTNDRNITPYHQQVTDFTIPAIVEQLEEESNYRARRKAIEKFNAASPVLKKGMALTPVKFGISFTATQLNQGGALLHMYSDGTVHLNHGGTEMGQGLFTKVAQIVSAELGIGTDAIRISATRTDKVPNTSPTAASSGTDINGMAALLAAQTIKERLVEHVCELYSCARESLQFGEYGVQVTDADSGMTWPQLAQSAWLARVSLSATGFYKTPDIYYNRETASGRPFLYFANGAAVTEVIIDTLTGETKVLRTDILHDVGNSINHSIDIGQIEGGYIQGLGWLTTEELKWDDNGRLLTDGPATYKIPAIGDTPPIFNVALLADSPNAENTVMRSKAVGEPPLMLAISAWCAIRDAISAGSGHTIFPPLNAPATPEEILRCIAVCNHS